MPIRIVDLYNKYKYNKTFLSQSTVLVSIEPEMHLQFRLRLGDFPHLLVWGGGWGTGTVNLSM